MDQVTKNHTDDKVQETPVQTTETKAVAADPARSAKGVKNSRAPRNDKRDSKGRGKDRNKGPVDKDLDELLEKIIFVNRVATVVKGGRRFSFAVLVAVGDHKGTVGIGIGKAKEVPEAVRKGLEVARKNMVKVSLRGPTIPHELKTKYRGAKVFMRPAPAGTGVIAGGAMRPIVELAGIKDIWTKSLGSNNHVNIARATIQALTDLRTVEQVAEARGKTVADLKTW
jgi:small subunit ribosomal protein S5